MTPEPKLYRVRQLKDIEIMQVKLYHHFSTDQ